MPSGELRDVAPHVLGRHLVVDAVVAPLEKRPERLDPVGVDLVAGVFSDAVLHGLMVGQTLVGAVLIGVDGGSGLSGILDEALKGVLVRALHDLGADHPGAPVLGPNHRHLADRPAAFKFLPLGPRHVSPLAAQVGFIDLDGASEGTDLQFVSLAKAVQHEPCGLLADPELTVQLHRGHALDVGGERVDGDRPGPVLELGAFHHRPGLEREHRLALALPAAVRHGPVFDAALDVAGAAERTEGTHRPSLLCDPGSRGFLRAEKARYLHQRQAVSSGSSRCVSCHVSPPCYVTIR